ncbi:MAG: CpsB/CapC family capsule biosynthesis tyrosine phosphatase [Thermodesulfobacteriota bacterium]
MIDLHCHILPGLDDGPASLQQSLAMAEIAEADGITKIVATPHIRSEVPSPDQIATACRNLNGALRKKGLQLEILPGAETYAMAAPALLTDRTINSTRYILIEFPLTHLPVGAGQFIFNLRVHGFKPIIAHPERIPNIIARPQLLKNLLDEQVYVQLTVGSLTGSFGPDPEKCARYLLQNGLVHFLASDGHGVDYRQPLLAKGLKIATKLIGNREAQRLVFANPQAVLAGHDIYG